MHETHSIIDLFTLSTIQGIGNNRLRSLITHFGSPSAVLQATPAAIAKVQGISKKLASAIVHHIPNKKFIDGQLSRLNKVNGKIITLWDSNYPELLKKIYDPPPFFFICGNFSQNDKYSIAVIGTRKPSTYGKLMTEKFAQQLSKKGITIISGLARGIDTVAHTATLQSDGRTIAIIGSGLDYIYPPENKKIAKQIESQGAIISEFFMGTKPNAENFPRRNRIISGLSLGTLVIESAEDGGAIITAELALDQQREVFCVPGNITEKTSIGTNKLIRENRAKLVQSVDDIIIELEHQLAPIIKPTTQKPHLQLSIFEQKIFNVLSTQPIHIDTIAELTSLPTSDTLVHLLSMEFKGIIKQLLGKMFIRA